MSYDIYIGEGIIDENDDSGELRVRVKGLSLPEAPSFPNDQMTGKGNSRHPGYSQWSNFCREAGIYDLFFDEETGLMHRHPGTFILKQNHLDEIRAAKDRWVKNNPDKNPGFPADEWMKPEFQEKITNPDPILARLIWLEFWVDWALKNCKVPAIHNH